MAEKDEDIIVVEDESADSANTGEIDSSKDEENEKKEVKQLTKKPRRGSDGNTKRGSDNQKRMNELWARAKENEQRALNEKAKNTEYEKITASALEDSINTKRELLTERLIRAQEAGDTKKSAEITAEMTKIEAQSAQIERYKIENQVRGNNQQNQQQQREIHQEQNIEDPEDLYENLSPAGKKWMDNNRDWYTPDGGDYDSEMAGDVTYYAQTLESEYKSSGRTAEIGTKSYFKKIDDYIKNNWSDDVPDANNEEEEKPPQKKNYAAPVGNRHTSSQPPGQPRQYKISQQEKEFALAMNTKDKNGKPLSDDDKIKRFINLRETTPSTGPISMKNVKGA